MSQNSGKSLVALGLADSLIKRADRVGFFRPVFDGATIADDPMARLIREHFGLTEEQVGGAVSMTDALALIAEGDTEEISARAVSAYEKVAANSDVVIVDGVYLPANALSVEFDLNVQIARDLGLPVVAIVGAQEATVEEAVTAVDVARTELLASKADLLAIIVGRSEPELRDEIEKSVKRGDANLPVYVLPEIPELNAPTVGEVAEALKLDTEGIKAEDLGRDIHGIKVAAMNVSNFLNQFVDGDFVIVPGDRADIVAATLASALAPTFPAPSGVLLTGGLDALPGKNTAVGSLIDNAPFPVLSTTKDTFKSARAVSRVRGALTHKTAPLRQQHRRVSFILIDQPAQDRHLGFQHEYGLGQPVRRAVEQGALGLLHGHSQGLRAGLAAELRRQPLRPVAPPELLGLHVEDDLMHLLHQAVHLLRVPDLHGLALVPNDVHQVVDRVRFLQDRADQSLNLAAHRLAPR